MIICFLAPANSTHIVKWSGYFVSRGHEVHVISFTKGDLQGVTVHYIDCGVDGSSSDTEKLKYLLKVKAVRKIIRELHPDIVNAHYATSYGTVAALTGVPNYIVSVWGSDIYDFPRKSVFHKLLLRYCLCKAPWLFSTSQAMAKEAAKYTNKHFEITPFGVDTRLFNPNKRKRTDNNLIIGTIKGLDYKYGIDYLLKAVAIIRKEHPEIPLRLRIAGIGPAEQDFRELARELRIDDITTWLGFISQTDAAREWASFDIGVVYSSRESFGVAAVEAEASSCPVVISDIPGLMEATNPGFTSVVVPRENEESLAQTIFFLINSKNERVKMGKNGRQFVLAHYEYEMCFQRIEKLFFEIRELRDIQ